jgi:hypothetical protein
MADRRSLPPYEDELSLALLRSAEHDEPPAAAYSKVAAALGVSAAVGLGASVPAQAALASGGLSASAAARWSGSLFAKVAVVGLSSVLLIAGGVALARHRSSVNARARVAARSATVSPSTPLAPADSVHRAGALAHAVPMPTPTNPVTSVIAPVRELASPASAPVAAPAVKSAAAPSAQLPLRVSVRTPKASSLPEQVLSLDRARVALDAGDSAAALAEISHYRSAWPRGVFLTEASVIEIEALAKRGEIALAGTRAQAFVTAHPDYPQAERLRALIHGDQ